MSEAMRNKFENIFNRVQNDSSCHRKYVKLLTDLYKSTLSEDFTKIFLEFLFIIAQQTADTNVYVKRSLIFSSRLCAEITRIEEKNEDNHPFLTQIIDTVLKWSCKDHYSLRYNSCRFLTMVLQDIGEEVQLEIDLIEEIQRVLLDRSKENKVQLRHQAMSALVRLQDPNNLECPVMNSYLRELSSGSTNIRKEALTHVAPNNMTVNKIKERIRDVDPNVRSVAFHRCADIGPLAYKIVDKHMILLCGFKETNQNVKSTIYDYLLPKWLTAYKGDFLKFVSAIKLIADDEDVRKMEYLCHKLIKYFYEKHPVNDLIAVLPINNDKVIEEKDLTNEVSIFWQVLVNLLRQNEDMEEYLTRIVPELTQFCHYIEKLVNVKSMEEMDEWKSFEYQFDLFNLLEIAEKYDFSDEVGRRTMQSLTLKILQKYTFTARVTKKLVSIAYKCSSNVDTFTLDMCQVISEIEKPFTEQPLSENELIQKKFKIAEVKHKIFRLEDEQSAALDQRDYQKVHLLEQELITWKKQLEEMQSVPDSTKIQTVKTDNETLCRCLDVLISVLELPEIVKPTPALLTCRDSFLVPLITNFNTELHWRVLNCLVLLSIIDKATAEQYAKIICFPMATYRTIPTNNVSAIIRSVNGVVDLISKYGLEIIAGHCEEENINSVAVNKSVTKRKLYTNDSEENLSTTNNKNDDNMTLSNIFEILLEMLDDERDEIRVKAIFAITILIKQGIPVSASVMSRIILKWCNPITARQDSRLQVGLGLLMEFYVNSKDSYKILREAIVPTLSCIANAPRTSPLFDTDKDNLLTFFAETMNIELKKEDIKNLVLDTCTNISNKLHDPLVILLAKFLNNLHIEVDKESIDELVDRVETLLESIADKIVKRHLEKFLSKLKLQRSLTTVNTTRRSEANDENEVTENGVLEEKTVENTPEGSKQVKRRKRENKKSDCVVVLERIDENKKDDTVLHTIIETSMERMEIDEDLAIQTSTSESSSSSQRKNIIVISETSESDHDTESIARRSNRLRKKRIL